MFFVGIVSLVGDVGFVFFCGRASLCHSGWPGTQDPPILQPPECGDYRHVPPHLVWYSLLLNVHFWPPLHLHILAWKAFEVACLVLHAIFHVLTSLKSGRLNITNHFLYDLGSLRIGWLEAWPWAGESQGHILTSPPPFALLQVPVHTRHCPTPPA